MGVGTRFSSSERGSGSLLRESMHVCRRAWDSSGLFVPIFSSSTKLVFSLCLIVLLHSFGDHVGLNELQSSFISASLLHLRSAPHANEPCGKPDDDFDSKHLRTNKPNQTKPKYCTAAAGFQRTVTQTCFWAWSHTLRAVRAWEVSFVLVLVLKLGSGLGILGYLLYLAGRQSLEGAPGV